MANPKQRKRNTISITIESEIAGKPKLRHQIKGIPWYAGMTVLHAMVLAQAMHTKEFSFRVVYDSMYGAFVDRIDTIEDEAGYYWLLYVDGTESPVGASEALINEAGPGMNIDIAWRYVRPGAKSSQGRLKAKRRGS